MSRDIVRSDDAFDSGSEAPQAFEIEYTEVAWRHLTALKAYERRIVADAVDKQLLHQPTIETRRRKQLRPNLLAMWELKVGNLRVLYNVMDAERKVVVVAIGRKRGNRIQINGAEAEL